MKRKVLSKKTRFDVFKRDNFVCQYCGGKPPSVVLQVDHIKPVFAGGCNDIDNLITACFECNIGKGRHTLESTPETVAIKIEIAKERECQLNELSKFIKKKRKREDADIDEIEKTFGIYYKEYTFTEKFREASVRKFLQHIDVDSLCGYLHSACVKTRDRQSATKYFCGIAWNVIKRGSA